MNCSSCRKSFQKSDLRVIESSFYCNICESKIFSKSSPKLTDRLVKSIAEKDKAKKAVKTPRNGRVEYIINIFVAWILLPSFMNAPLSGYPLFKLFSVSVIESRVNFDFHLSILWGLPIILSYLYTCCRIQDLGWSNKVALIMWLPFVNFILFIWPGNQGENKYGVAPQNPSFIKVVGAFISVLIMFVISYAVILLVASVT